MSQTISKSSQKNSIWFHGLGIILSRLWPHPLESSFIYFKKNSTCLQSSSFINLFLACRIWGMGGWCPAVFFHFVLSLYLSVQVGCISAEIHCKSLVDLLGLSQGFAPLYKKLPYWNFLDNPISISGFCWGSWGVHESHTFTEPPVWLGSLNNGSSKALTTGCPSTPFNFFPDYVSWWWLS